MKGHFRNAEFMDNLRANYAAMGSDHRLRRGRPHCGQRPESCRDIFQALLDHRLDSRLSMRMYDVQSTELVG